MTKTTLHSKITRLIFSVPLALLSVILAGCQALPSPVLGISVPIYATIADAQAVAAGQFGAIPVEIASEFDLEVVLASCGSIAAQVRTRSGKVGWIPMNSLPQELGSCQHNPSPGTAWKWFQSKKYL